MKDVFPTVMAGLGSGNSYSAHAFVKFINIRRTDSKNINDKIIIIITTIIVIMNISRDTHKHKCQAQC